MDALKAPETRREWPRRLNIAFDFIIDLLSKSLEAFVTMTKNNPKWAQYPNTFLNFQREKVTKKGCLMQLFPTSARQ